MKELTLWEGHCGAGYHTRVGGQASQIRIYQEVFSGDCVDEVVMDRAEAVDIAFSILRDCVPTIAAALQGVVDACGDSAEHTAKSS